jgi:hypothetical protein
MRLLNTKSLELSPPYVPSEVPDYVILSHRWSTEEVTFANISKAPISDLQSPTRTKSGFAKIEGACKLALQDGYTWIWIDSCCIDKSSSAELQEAINSMWRYYAESNICYVYLADIPDSEAGWSQTFAESVWFTRGWTLQELLAPVYVDFYAKNWEPIGTKFERHKEIAEITLINPKALIRAKAIDLFSTAERFSWAAHRNVTREEDEAYSLLGLFDVNMPLLYGEGRAKAFARLQEAIYSSTADQSMFLFRYGNSFDDQLSLLADSPTRFCERMNCISCVVRGVQVLPSSLRYADIVASDSRSSQAHEQIVATVTRSQNKVSTELSLLDYSDIRNTGMLGYLPNNIPQIRETRVTHVAVLNCTLETQPTISLCLLLHQLPEWDKCIRLSAYPALWRGYHSPFRCQKTKLLFCPDPTFRGSFIANNFSFESNSFRVDRWDFIPGSSAILSAEARQDSSFEIQTWKFGFSRKSVEIFCQTVGSHDPSLLLSVCITQMPDEMWSIKDVCERKQGSWQQIFVPSVLTDRCSIQLPDGEELIVQLRRLPSTARARQVDGKVFKIIQYQITVDIVNRFSPYRRLAVNGPGWR